MSLRSQPGNRGPSVWSGQVSFRLNDDKATRLNNTLERVNFTAWSDLKMNVSR